MDIKVRDLKQTDKIENNNKLLVLVDDDLNLVKNITKEEFLTNVISDTENNALVQETDGNLYVNTSEIAESVTELDNKFTNQIGDLNKLTTEAKNNLVSAINEAAQSASGSGTGGFNLFDPVIKDHILSFEESKGFALQGTYVYKTGITGERYGYPDFIQKCIAEKTAGTTTQVTLGNYTITMYVNANGHKFYNIADKAVVDAFYNSTGIADFYGVDEENERIFLPRNDWFMQLTTDTNQINNYNEPKLPNIKGGLYRFWSNGISGSGAISANNFENHAWSMSTVAGQTLSNAYLDASKSSSVYKNNVNTVQPPSSNKLLYYVVGNTSEVTYVTTTIPDSEVLSQLNTKTNASQAAAAAMPSDRYTELTLGASGASYIAPSDGYFSVGKQGKAGQWLNIISGEYNGGNVDQNVFVSGTSFGDGYGIHLFLAVHKGQQISIVYTAEGVIHQFRFYYAEGAS